MLHHEAAHLPLAPMAEAHQFHNTTVGMKYDSSIWPIHASYDQHLDGISREGQQHQIP